MAGKVKRKPVWFDYAVKQWAENKSDNAICDGIMDEFGINLAQCRIYSIRKAFPESFAKRSKALSSAIAADTLVLNRLLRSNRRVNVIRELKRLGRL